MDRLDIVSPVGYRDHNSNDVCHGQNFRHQEQGLKSEGIENDSTEVGRADSNHVDSDKLTTLAEHDKSIKPNSQKADMKHGAKKNSKRTLQKGKKASQSLRGKRYFLRSSLDGVRVLRSMSKGKSKTPAESVTPPVNPTTKRRKRRGKVKGASKDEFSLTRKRVRYLLTRINYEQSLIDAYSSEGWKGQSLEKLRPEKELERAKSEILRCKLKIRDSFRCLDSLLSAGRLQESLFDSDGQICSEDIFCAKCSSKDLSVDNDIILCDGACDRGFHQKCLDPPLLSENIPSGDEGWLCPACDCKVDCIDLLSEFQGSSDLSIEDSWEKVFPEAAAIANSDKQYDLSNLPSDDSEDDNYDPDVLEVDTEDHMEESSSEEDHEEQSSSEESYFTYSSEDSGPSEKRKHYEDIGLSSDDSEDDDYDPEGPDPDKEIQKESSGSDESDFTSDSDDFCAELSKSGGTDEVSASSLPNLKPLEPSGEGERVSDRNENATNSEQPSMLEPDPSQKNALPVSGKRQRDRLDYKKLYDETYGKASSDSSDDEDWSDKNALKKGKKDDHVEETDVLKARSKSTENYRSSGRAKRKATVENIVTKSDLVQKQVLLATSEDTPKKAYQQKLQSASLHHTQKHDDPWEPDSNGDGATTSVQRRFDPVVTQKLHDSFKENQYPSRETKERLAIELGMTSRQIGKWFENARHSMRVSAKEANHAVVSTPEEGTSSTKAKGNNDKPDKGGVRNYASNGSKGKKSVGERNDEVGAGRDTSSGEKRKDTQENNRKKAIERELRKRRKSR
uniref:Homeobox protein HOX1A isoform X1 n=2 Tax=Elaeis guineensis var. tenera TaxID=51953 RepID=A0A6I9QBT9_ELAGV|nr:homeobox protein HOX1A isoform X1 [Elaeis guineensis]XP_010906633.1 homeobox protein HOX1A isoform X1 [Elaeis guineensis]